MRPEWKLPEAQVKAPDNSKSISTKDSNSFLQEHDDENWEFRSWLKQHAPDDIDGLVKTLSQKYFALIDLARSAQITADHCTSNSRKVSFTLLQKRLASR